MTEEERFQHVQLTSNKENGTSRITAPEKSRQSLKAFQVKRQAEKPRLSARCIAPSLPILEYYKCEREVWFMTPLYSLLELAFCICTPNVMCVTSSVPLVSSI